MKDKANCLLPASFPSDSVQRPREFCWPGDDELRAAAFQLLKSSGYAALRSLHVEVTEAVVVLHGVVPFYFLKQMAQTVIQRLDGIRSVTNLVEVSGAEEKDRCYGASSRDGTSDESH